MGDSKNRGKPPKMDGENNGKPYFLMDDLEVPLFLETTKKKIYIYIYPGSPKTICCMVFP